jgi:hypothetical protein
MLHVAALYSSRLGSDSSAPGYNPRFTAMVVMCGGGTLFTTPVSIPFIIYVPRCNLSLLQVKNTRPLTVPDNLSNSRLLKKITDFFAS